MNSVRIEPSKVRELRERAMLSQQEVADAVGVSAFTTWRWEQGNDPVGIRPSAARKLAEVLNAGPGELAPLGPAKPDIPPLMLAAMYDKDAATRRRALEAAAAEDRAAYRADLDRAIERAEAVLMEDAQDAAAASDDDAKRLYTGRRAVLRRYIGRLAALSDEAAGVSADPPTLQQAEELLHA